MEHIFREFLDRITLTTAQKDDAQTKYEGVCEKLHTSYYNSKYTGDTKFLFGSYKNKTNIKPITPNQDVDVIFKIPEEEFNKYKNYASNGPSALLENIRKVLKEKYTTTEKIKAWGKIVKVEFSDGTHNVEVLPALELKNKKFEIPNTEGGGSWEIFDPRSQIDKLQESNQQSNGKTIEIVRMLKTWNNNTISLLVSSYNLETDVISFLELKYSADKTTSILLKDFFEYFFNKSTGDIKSHVKTALDRSSKALEFETNNKYDEACEEWSKIFGKDFPTYFKESSINKSSTLSATPSPWCRNDK